MKTPYDILEVTEQASDADIKQAYLQKVKQYPPDHYHAMFQQIHTAYQTIKDQTSRLNYTLFHYPEADFDTLLDHGLTSTAAVSVDYNHFDKLLRASIDDSIFKFSMTHTPSKT